jgi:hypothetical protein
MKDYVTTPYTIIGALENLLAFTQFCLFNFSLYEEFSVTDIIHIQIIKQLMINLVEQKVQGDCVACFKILYGSISKKSKKILEGTVTRN